MGYDPCDPCDSCDEIDILCDETDILCDETDILFNEADILLDIVRVSWDPLGRHVENLDPLKSVTLSVIVTTPDKTDLRIHGSSAYPGHLRCLPRHSDAAQLYRLIPRIMYFDSFAQT